MQYKNWRTISNLEKESLKLPNCAGVSRPRRKRCCPSMRTQWMRPRFQKRWRTSSSSSPPRSMRNSNTSTTSSRDTTRSFSIGWPSPGKRTLSTRTTRCSNPSSSNTWMEFRWMTKCWEHPILCWSSTTGSISLRSQLRRSTPLPSSRPMWSIIIIWPNSEEWHPSVSNDYHHTIS